MTDPREPADPHAEQENPKPEPEPLRLNLVGLRAQKSGAEVEVTVIISAGDKHEGRILDIRTCDFQDLKLKKGPISIETLERMEQAEEFWHALQCGERLLAYGSNTRQLLARKIARRGYSRRISEAAAAELDRMGLVNEEDYLRREVERGLDKLWGEGRIRNQLYTRGFGHDTMALLPEVLADVDLVGNCAALIEKLFGELPDDYPEERRMIGVLFRYGYRMSEIRAAVRRLREAGQDK